MFTPRRFARMIGRKYDSDNLDSGVPVLLGVSPWRDTKKMIDKEGCT